MKDTIKVLIFNWLFSNTNLWFEDKFPESPRKHKVSRMWKPYNMKSGNFSIALFRGDNLHTQTLGERRV